MYVPAATNTWARGTSEFGCQANVLEPNDYGLWVADDLKGEAAKRGLRVAKNKGELVSQLIEDDQTIRLRPAEGKEPYIVPRTRRRFH